MTDRTPPFEDDDDRETRAAEYALGTMGGEACEVFARELASDPDLRARVAAWQERLQPLASAVPPVPPSAGLWRNIEAAIDAPVSPAAIETVGRRDPAAFWRWTAIASLAAAAALAFTIAVTPVPAPGPAYVAVLNDTAAQSPGFVVTVNLHDKELSVRPSRPVSTAGRDLELWLIPAGSQTPQSLGLVDAAVATTKPIEGAALLTLAADAALAISLEPQGGSPSGAPTGPVLFAGPVVALGPSVPR
ncbi:MAG: anti-sigma factor domain-containing protein [Gemmatimonas sp.]